MAANWVERFFPFRYFRAFPFSLVCLLGHEYCLGCLQNTPHSFWHTHTLFLVCYRFQLCHGDCPTSHRNRTRTTPSPPCPAPARLLLPRFTIFHLLRGNFKASNEIDTRSATNAPNWNYGRENKCVAKWKLQLTHSNQPQTPNEPTTQPPDCRGHHHRHPDTQTPSATRV